MALVSTQPLTGLSKGMGKVGRCVGLTNLQHSLLTVLKYGSLKPLGTTRACPGLLELYPLCSENIFNIHFYIIFRLTTNPIFYSVSEGPWNISVSVWGFVILDYFYKWWTSGINDDWQLEEKPVIIAGYTVVVTCLQVSITCTGAYHFTAAGLMSVCQSECTWHIQTNASVQHSGYLLFREM
jgi:hypothetical protein